MNKRKQVISIAVATAFTLTTVVNAVPAVVYAHEVDKQIELDMYGDTSADMVIDNNTEDKLVNDETIPEIESNTTDNTIDLTSSNTIWNDEKLPVLNLQTSKTTSSSATLDDGNTSADTIINNNTEDTSVNEETMQEIESVINDNLDNPVETISSNTTIISSNDKWDIEKTLSGDLVVNPGVTLIINKKVTISGDVTISGGGIIKLCGDLVVNKGKNLNINMPLTIDDNVKISGEGTIKLCGDLVVNQGKTLTINAPLTIAKNVTISGGGTVKLCANLVVNQGVVLLIDPLLTTTADKYLPLTIANDVTISGGGIIMRGRFKGHLISVLENKTLTLNNIIVDGGAKYYGETDPCLERGTKNRGSVAEGALVNSSGKLIIEKYTYLQNNYCNKVYYAKEGVSAAVYVNKGTIEMNGGKICNNYGSKNGAGIFITRMTDNSNTVLTLNDGEICHNNTAGNEGGAGIFTYENMIMKKGKIHNNSSNKGAGIRIGGADVTIDGEEIEIFKNESQSGGGIYQSGDNRNTLVTVNKGKIYGNKSNAGGAIYSTGLSQLTINKGADINNNESNGFGGAILLDKCDKLEIKGGNIYKNKSEVGGGIYICNGTKEVNIIEGNIYENESKSCGGGIYIYDADQVNLTGGTISGNSIDNDKGGGAYISMYKALTLGDVIIENNKLINSDNSITDNITIDTTFGDNYLSPTENFPGLHFSNFENPIVFKPSPGVNLSTDILKKMIYKSNMDNNNYTMWYSSDGNIYSTKIVTNGGEIPDTTTYIEDVLAEPIKNHHIFMGWYDNVLFTGKPLSKSNKPDARKTYYAKWEKSSYKVDDEVNFELKYNNIQAKDFTVSVNNGTPTISSVIGSNDKFTAEVDKTNKAKIVVTPASNLNVGTYTGTLTVTTGDNATHLVTVTLNITENKVPTINAQDKTLIVGNTFEPLNGVTAYDEEDGEIKDIKYDSNVDVTKPGIYTVTYKVTDSQGATVTKTITVTVEAKANKPKKKNDNEKIDYNTDNNSNEEIDYNTNNNSIASQIITNSDGSKKIILADGTVAIGWNKVNEKWYLSDANGVVEKGWVKNNNEWYYFNDNGEMQTKWIKDSDNKWYYCGADGAMKTGWLKDTDGAWYHLNNSGAMSTGWLKDTDGAWYHLNNSGAMSTGWIKDINNKWYYLDNSGKMRTGWIKLDNKWYYLYSDGSMAENTIIDGYLIGNDGSWINN